MSIFGDITKRVSTAAAGVVLAVGLSSAANAGILAVVGDVNAGATSATNASFYEAVLGDSSTVVFSRGVSQQGDTLGFYNSLTGVTATESAAELTAASLSTIDLLVVTAFFNDPISYTAAEIAAVSGFLGGGGSVLMVTEASSAANLGGYNAFLAGVGSSISYTGFRNAGTSPTMTAESTTLGALDPFRVSAYNTLTGGTAVYNAPDGTVVAFEDFGDVGNGGGNGGGNGVPAPSTVLLLAIGLLAASRRRVS